MANRHAQEMTSHTSASNYYDDHICEHSRKQKTTNDPSYIIINEN